MKRNNIPRRKPGGVFARVGVLAIVLFIASCQPKTRLHSLNIFFTGDIQGRLVPCGCFTGQLGGMTRLKTVLNTLAATHDIRVDIGDALKGSEDYQVIQHRYLLRAFAAMGYDALNLGHREARLSVRQLRSMKQSSPVKLLSANLLDRATGERIFDAYRIVQRGGRRIALVGVMDSRGLGDSLGEGLAVEKMEVALGKLLPELKNRADVIVLLAFTDEATLASLARDFYEFAVILGGKVSQPSQKLNKENRSLIFYVTNESRALGILGINLSGSSKLTAGKHEIMLLHEDIPQDEWVQKLAEAYRTEIRATRLAVDDPTRLQENRVPGVRVAASYVGTDRCEGCHPEAARKWQQTQHARAFATLIQRQAEADPNCIPCHTVGFGSLTGYRREFGNQKLVDVGCESCHGPGSLHVDQRLGQGAVSFQFRPLGAGDCKKCHYGEFSRPFDYEVFWPHIYHGKEPAKAVKMREK